MGNAKTRWIKKVQSSTSPNVQTPGWELVKEDTSILRCSGRISGYNPIYIKGGLFGEKLIAHMHEQIMHLGVANTMANIRNEWWIPRLRSKVKKVINRRNTCKVFSTKPYGSTTTAATLRFWAEEEGETTGVDFTGPLDYKVTKKERGKIMLCLDLHLCHLKSGTPGSNEITDGRGVSEKAELVHCQEDQTSSHHFRQRLGIQGYCMLDKENTEEQEATRPSCERRHQIAIQPFQIPMVGWNV